MNTKDTQDPTRLKLEKILTRLVSRVNGNGSRNGTVRDALKSDYYKETVTSLTHLLIRSEKEGYSKGYNSGWRAASRVKPEKFAYFAEQLEYAASILRNMETELITSKTEREVE